MSGLSLLSSGLSVAPSGASGSSSSPPNQFNGLRYFIAFDAHSVKLSQNSERAFFIPSSASEKENSGKNFLIARNATPIAAAMASIGRRIGARAATIGASMAMSALNIAVIAGTTVVMTNPATALIPVNNMLPKASTPVFNNPRTLTTFPDQRPAVLVKSSIAEKTPPNRSSS